MPTHVFKKKLEPALLFDFLKPICAETATYAIVNSESMKIAMYTNHYEDFIRTVGPYYYESKRFYLKSDPSYKAFLTIIRQICNFNNIAYKSIIKYAHSSSTVEYYVYFNDLLDSTLLPK